MKRYFVTGIDTDSGKTLASAICCEALQADYWKPIQSGTPRDAETVKSLLTNTTSQIHPERYLLQFPASPHASSKMEGVHISLNEITPPETNNNLIVEGAGGCLVPINDEHFIIDIIKQFKIEVILVADLYLGSINHTLLSIEALKSRDIRIKGIVFNGESNSESERIILLHSKLECLLRITKEPVIDKQVVARYAEKLREKI